MSSDTDGILGKLVLGRRSGGAFWKGAGSVASCQPKEVSRQSTSFALGHKL